MERRFAKEDLKTLLKLFLQRKTFTIEQRAMVEKEKLDNTIERLNRTI